MAKKSVRAKVFVPRNDPAPKLAIAALCGGRITKPSERIDDDVDDVYGTNVYVDFETEEELERFRSALKTIAY